MYEDVIKFVQAQFATSEFVPLHEPRFWGNEKKYLEACIDSTFVSSVGEYVDQFEDMVRDYTGARYAIATSNGTSGLHAALVLANVCAGDEVITQPLTFIASCNAISYCGASPIFVDIGKDTLGMSPENLRKFLDDQAEMTEEGCRNKTTGAKIAAVLPMHTFGHPCKIDEIRDICAQYQIPLVEDAAEGLGSFYKGRHVGTFGDLGVFSFNGNKTVTTGGGGVIITDDDDLAKRAKHITTTAKVPHPYLFVHDEVGFNYRLPNLNAALGCAQMENLEMFITSKRQLAAEYAEFFHVRKIDFVEEPENCQSNYWLNALIMSDERERDAFIEETNAAGVMTRPAWTLMNQLEMYKHCQAGDLTVAEWAAGRLVNIPSSARKNT